MMLTVRSKRILAALAGMLVLALAALVIHSRHPGLLPGSPMPASPARVSQVEDETPVGEIEPDGQPSVTERDTLSATTTIDDALSEPLDDEEAPEEAVDPEAIEQLAAADLVEFIELNLDRVYQGDVGAGHRIERAFFSCERTPTDPDVNLVDLAASLHRRQEPPILAMRKAWTSSSPYSVTWNLVRRQEELLPGAPMMPAASEQETVTRLTQWGEACRDQNRLFTPALRDKLEALARAGNPAARYLYATWRPGNEERRDTPDEFVLLQSWERNAREFTRQNLAQGEPAGLMAYAMSFRGGLFTGSDPQVALPLFLAALDCGFPAPDLQVWLESVVEELDDPSAEAFLPFLQEAERHKQRCKP